LKHLETLDILDADTFKPLLKGTDLAKAMNLKPGPWMKDALEVVMAWQLRNPNITDPTEAIEEVKKTRKGELTSRLISKFLSLTIRPLFLQTDPDKATTSSKNKLKTWRDPENEYAVDLLRWALETSTESDIKREFNLLRAPILQMLDDNDLKWKAKACEFVGLFVRAAPRDLIMGRGYKQMFTDELFPLFTYLPTLTPEEESVLVFDHAFSALVTLSLIEEAKDERMLDKIVREGVLAPLFHFTSPLSYPNLTTVILTHLSAVLDELRIKSVKHLQSILPPLLNILRDHFAPASPRLLIAAAKGLQSTIRNGWPRIASPRLLEISTASCESWIACAEFEQNSTDLENVKHELKVVMRMVDQRIVMLADDQEMDVWNREKTKLVAEGSIFKELFEGVKRA
jgi:tRNA nucleotidyltransferase (CCA-adding enzyme)